MSVRLFILLPYKLYNNLEMTLFIYVYVLLVEIAYLAVSIGLYVRIEYVDMFDLFDNMYLE